MTRTEVHSLTSSNMIAHFGHRDAMYAIDNQDPEGGQAWGSSA